MAELFESPKKNRVWAHLDKLFTPGFYEYLTDASNFNAVPTEKGNAYKDLHRALADNSVAEGFSDNPAHFFSLACLANSNSDRGRWQ